MEELSKQKLTKSGPILVSLANAARAFDAPVRYPLLFSAPGMWVETFALPKGSSFITLIEHFFGLIILLPILGFTRGFSKLKAAIRNFDKRDWISLAYISIGGSALGLFFFLMSMVLGNPTIAILVQKVQPIVTVLFAFFILKEKPSLRFYIAFIFSLIGIILMSMTDILNLIHSGDYSGLIAILFSLIAAILWGGSTVFGRILTKKVDFWDLTLLRYAGGFIFLLVFNIPLMTYNSTYFNFLGEVRHVFSYETEIDPGIYIYTPVNWTWIVILCILYFAVLTGGVMPLSLYYFGLERSKASIAGIAELAFPILSIVVNYYFLGYGLDWFQGSGAIILLITISTLSFINTREAERMRSKEKERNQ
ncbi:MAG: DMT family transporter [Candidatus Heimdallarchaeaceae archaeon]